MVYIMGIARYRMIGKPQRTSRISTLTSSSTIPLCGLSRRIMMAARWWASNTIRELHPISRPQRGHIRMGIPPPDRPRGQEGHRLAPIGIAIILQPYLPQQAAIMIDNIQMGGSKLAKRMHGWAAQIVLIGHRPHRLRLKVVADSTSSPSLHLRPVADTSPATQTRRIKIRTCWSRTCLISWVSISSLCAMAMECMES